MPAVDEDADEETDLRRRLLRAKAGVDLPPDAKPAESGALCLDDWAWHGGPGSGRCKPRGTIAGCPDGIASLAGVKGTLAELEERNSSQRLHFKNSATVSRLLRAAWRLSLAGCGSWPFCRVQQGSSGGEGWNAGTGHHRRACRRRSRRTADSFVRPERGLVRTALHRPTVHGDSSGCEMEKLNPSRNGIRRPACRGGLSSPCTDGRVASPGRGRGRAGNCDRRTGVLADVVVSQPGWSGLRHGALGLLPLAATPFDQPTECPV
jgi:hypothetical protein